jgi:hypothetical protein
MDSVLLGSEGSLLRAKRAVAIIAGMDILAKKIREY